MKNNIDRKVLDHAGNYDKEFSPDVNKAWLKFQKKKNKLEGDKVAKRRFLVPLSIAASFLILLSFYLNFNTNNAFQTKETFANQTAHFDLPDGSKIWMNENSTIAYFSTSEEDRKVELNGEIFFEVAENPNNPFTITTGGATIEVVGTSFNVKNTQRYVEVEVESGLVKVNGQKIRPGQRIMVEPDGSFEIDKGLNIGGWVNKELHFNKTALSIIIDEIQEIYDVEIAVRNTALHNCPFSTEFNNETIENVLEVLKTGFGCELKKVTDQAFVLKGGSCR